MIKKKANLLNIDYAILNYEEARDIIIEKAIQKTSYGVSALAVHGLIESVRNQQLKEKIQKIQMVVPDGQPIRWALNSLHQVGQKDRIYGPKLTESVLATAATLKLKVFLYGSTTDTLSKLVININQRFPGVEICGIHADRFREATAGEDAEDIQKINASQANIILVGRGCPRQEAWVADHLGQVNGVMMAVGAAFDFIAGTKKQAPNWMQDIGLEWFFRLMEEPNRLFKRYLSTNSAFIYLFLQEKLKSQFLNKSL